ncbi:hypothetical protein [Streptomyces gilvus]|uniref:hypothetical protein n=1 Tax=Streptomyces gilvus TaxID=2920937 RepID=UPI001F0EF295|nr:hypothetical protein [Streptomyces sp. CME 23]MCH5677700.1 hypothetical protein [Streptomyces sp. CME 23]
MIRVRRIVAALGALAAVTAAAGPATAASADSNQTYIGFIAPTAGQAVQFGVNGGAAYYCFRWPGGVNTGAPTYAMSGMELWNPYLGIWQKEADWKFSREFRTTELTAQLFANADNLPGDGLPCKGKPLSAERKLPDRPAVDVYYVDFR